MRCSRSRSECRLTGRAWLPLTIVVAACLCAQVRADDERLTTGHIFTLRRTALFQTTCQRDYAEALQEWAYTEARQSFERFDRILWTSTTPKKGWSYFMSTAVMAVEASERNQPLIVFYHPWSDVFLVTMWTEMTAQPWLVDAEVITGAWVRRDTVQAPAAAGLPAGETSNLDVVAQNTAATLQAFRRRFGGIDPRNWREGLTDLIDPQVRETLDYPVAGQRLKDCLARVDDFECSGDQADPRLRLLREETEAAVKLGAAGRIHELLAEASETSTETAARLRKLSPQQFEALAVATTAIGSEASAIFLSAPGRDWFVTFHFFGTQKTQRLGRIDLLTFAGIARVE